MRYARSSEKASGTAGALPLTYGVRSTPAWNAPLPAAEPSTPRPYGVWHATESSYESHSRFVDDQQLANLMDTSTKREPGDGVFPST